VKTDVNMTIMSRYMFRAQVGDVEGRERNGMFSVTVELVELQDRVVSGITTLEEFPAGMEDSLDDVIATVIADLDLDDNDRLGVTITATDSAGYEYVIHVPLHRVHAFDAGLILNTILAVLPSSLSIALTMTLKFSAIKEPEEDVPSDETIAEGKSSEHRFLHRVSRKSTRVVVIHPDDDPYADLPDCIFQWIAIGIAFLVKNGCRLPQSLQLMLPTLGITERTYNQLIRGRRKFDDRQELGENVMQTLGCNLGDPALVVLQRAEEMFQCNCVLFNVQKGFKVYYPLPENLPRIN